MGTECIQQSIPNTCNYWQWKDQVSNQAVCDKYREELFNPWSLHEWLPSTIKPLLSGHLQGMVEWPLDTVQVPKNRGNIKNRF